MKKYLVLLASMLVFISAPAFSQFTFSVAPGLNLNSAYFGYKAGKVVPFVGFNMVAISGSLNETGSRWDDPEVVEYDETAKLKGSLLMPTLGLKFFAVEKNKVKGYVIASLTKPLVNAKLTFDGEEVEEISEMLDKLSFFGGTVGVGAEYFFDENFSLGGEFGAQFLNVKFKDEWESDVWNGSSYDEEDFTRTLKGTAIPTFSKISLNFYF